MYSFSEEKQYNIFLSFFSKQTTRNKIQCLLNACAYIYITTVSGVGSIEKTRGRKGVEDNVRKHEQQANRGG
jgi:hypothetical protein